MAKYSKNDIIRIVDEEDIEFIRLQFTDIFGTLKNVMETGANDVYIVDSVEHGEVLLPAIKECILDVDIETNTMTVHLMKGLL